MTVGAFLLILGASARLTRLANRDTILDWLRPRIKNDAVAYWLSCPYCIGIPITALVTAAWKWTPWQWFALAAAALTANLIWATIQDQMETWETLYSQRTAAMLPQERPRSRATTHTPHGRSN